MTSLDDVFIIGYKPEYALCPNLMSLNIGKSIQ